MIYLTGNEYIEAEKYINEAIKIAKNSSCLRSKCGSVIVKNNEIIGKGFNSPPLNLESQRRCLIDKNTYHKKVGDKSCCVHAEQRAIMDALTRNYDKISGSILYFIRLNQNNEFLSAGKPYCTHCSKLALDSNLESFVLWHEEGICLYNTEEYNNLSFDYRE